jgi:diadenosine tetraphosphate (Ap4A) HIT family hydrolase
MIEPCDGCKRVSEAQAGKNPHLITEFPNSFLFLGDHQYYEGYSVLMAKSHVRELHEMRGGEYSAVMEELMQATRAIQAAFDPWKMNHACLGNVLQHVHWHIMPRYESDEDRFHNPWYKMDEFKDRVPDGATRSRLIKRIQNHLGHMS